MQKKQRFVADQRYDLPQHERMLNFIDAEFYTYNKNFIYPLNRIVKGWTLINNGGLQVKVNKTIDSLLINPERADHETVVLRKTTDDDLLLDLDDNATNYVEVQIVTGTGAPDTVAIWDPTANAGQGEEFTQTVDTCVQETPVLVSNTVSFSGDPDKLPLAIVTTSGGNISTITDARELMFHVDSYWNFGSPRSDKGIGNLIEAYQALATAIKEIKGTPEWTDAPWPSVAVLKEFQNMFITGGGNIEWEGTQGANTLGWSSSMLIEIADRANSYTINAGSVILAEGEAMYVVIPADVPSPALTPIVAAIEDVPIDPTSVGFDPGIQIIFFRRNNKINGLLDMPELDSGEVAVVGVDLPSAIRTKLGITSETATEAYSAALIDQGFGILAGSSYPTAINRIGERTGTLLKADYIDLEATVLPSGVSATIDGASLVNGNRVLFANAALNGIYEIAGVGVAITWDKKDVFSGSDVPTNGDTVSIKSGTSYFKTVWRYRDSTIGWRPMESADISSEPTGFPNRDDSEISFDDGTRTFTIQPLAPATHFDYMTQGRIHRKSSAQTVVIPNTEGIHFIYFDGATLITSQVWSYEIIKEYAFVASVYWDATNSVGVLIGDERHGLTLDGATHKYLHNTVGCRWVSGLSLGNFTTGGTGAANADAQMSVSNGLMYDEDIELLPVHNAAPSSPFEQILDPIAEIPVLYRDGAAGDWRKAGASQYPVSTGVNRIQYNNPAGPWTQPEATSDGNFVAMWIFGTNSITEPIIAIMGQREDTTLANAQANNSYESLSFGVLPSNEMKVLYRLIFETSSAFTNAPKASLRDVRDLRQAIDTSIAAFSASDHGLLTGLNDPDHPAFAIFTGSAAATPPTYNGALSPSDTRVSDALETLNKLLGQMRIKPHPSDPNRVVVRGAERTLNSGTKLIQEIKNLVMKFDGAEIEFTTGLVFKDDGVTPLGQNFAPVVVPAGNYQWYSVQATPGTSNLDNSLNVQLLILAGSSNNAVLANAPYAAFASNATKIGQVYVQSTGGGIQAITAANIRQLGVGSGSGSGSVGPGQLFIEELRRRLEDDGFTLNWLTPNVPEVHENDRVDVSSTGFYDIANGEYDLNNTEFLLTTQHYGSQFLLSEQENLQAELHALWSDGAIDDAATYELSKDGGANFETVTMERVGESNKFRGVHVFAEPPGTTQYEYDVINANAIAELNDNNSQSYAVKLSSLAAGVKKKILSGNVYINKVGSPTGDLSVKIVKDDANAPGDTVVGQNSDTISISSLSAGNNIVAIDIPAILVEGDYWLVIETTQAYKDNFNTGVDAVSVRVDSTSGTYPEGDSVKFNGTAWFTDAGNQAVFDLDGYTYDLRVKITASQTASLLGLGVFYGEQNPLVYDEHQAIQRFDLDGDDDETELTVTKFVPDPLTCKVYLVNTGQVIRWPAFAVDGRKLVFAAGQFLIPGETVYVLVDQSEAQVFDNSDMNANLLASNHLGSTDATIDRSQPGRGIIVQRPDGTKREITLDNFDNIVVLSVP